MRLFWSGILVFAISMLGFSHMAIAEDQSESLDVEISSDGVGTVLATLKLTSKREQVRSVLLDFPNWPRLFPRNPTIHYIKKLEGRVRVGMTVPAFFLPITLGLVTETREPHPFRIVTQMVEGDFERYDWIWELSSTQGGTHTIATLTFNIKPKIWTPDWALLWMLESDLREHFEILRAEVLAKDSQNSLGSP